MLTSPANPIREPKSIRMCSFSLRRRLYHLTVLLLLAGLAVVPLYASLAGQPFYVTLFSRIIIFSIAAVALDLILGVGGLISFGQALYFGLGAYVVGILGQLGIENGWLHLAATILLCGAVGLITGLIALRTAGIAFIMITLAFAQMLFSRRESQAIRRRRWLVHYRRKSVCRMVSGRFQHPLLRFLWPVMRRPHRRNTVFEGALRDDACRNPGQ